MAAVASRTPERLNERRACLKAALKADWEGLTLGRDPKTKSVKNGRPLDEGSRRPGNKGAPAGARRNPFADESGARECRSFDLRTSQVQVKSKFGPSTIVSTGQGFLAEAAKPPCLAPLGQGLL